jgi:hypothetical protein
MGRRIQIITKGPKEIKRERKQARKARQTK